MALICKLATKLYFMNQISLLFWFMPADQEICLSPCNEETLDFTKFLSML
jgi:hypothetical protein